MARCTKRNGYGKECGAHIIIFKHWETGAEIVCNFDVTTGGNIIATTDGYCGVVDPDEKRELLKDGVLFFNEHVCADPTTPAS